MEEVKYKNFKYNDIINYKYPNSEIERDFPDKVLREAQFAPFAALSGYEEVIAEKARFTEQKTELDKYEIEEINRTINFLKENTDTEINVTVRYFAADSHKSGGKYLDKTGQVTKVREYEKDIVFKDRTQILIENIFSIEIN